MEHNNNNNSHLNPLEQWLTEGYDYEQPQRGDIRKGIILEINEYGAIVDIGLKHDGIVPREDINRLTDETIAQLEPGQEVMTRIIRANDQEDSLVLSLAPVQTEQDWNEARELLEKGEIWWGKVSGYNRGGLLLDFGQLQGFIPASHLTDLYRQNYSTNKRQTKLQEYIGHKLPLQVIEADQEKQRLVLSERLAREQLHEERRDDLLDELSEGQVRQGTVSHLTDFGAFVDLGGVDGLIHISELAWRRIRHPSEVLQVGDKIEVQILSLDYKRKRINLSLKQLKPNPWSVVEMVYNIDQLVQGKVTNIVDFGVFVLLDTGIEGLVHISELADPPPEHPRELVSPGDKLVLRILQIDAANQRIALSLKDVSPEEREAWLAEPEQVKDG